MPSFTPKQLILLVLLTIVWGLNWPVMKLGVQHFPPLSFRMVSMWVGLPILALFVASKGLPLAIPRSYWGQLAKLTLFNMVLWHCLIIIAIPTLSSGRASYSMQPSHFDQVPQQIVDQIVEQRGGKKA